MNEKLNQMVQLPATPIGEGMFVAADIAAVVGFFVVMVVCVVLIRWLAVLLWLLILILTPIALCYLLHQKEIKTWEELGVVVGAAGISAAISLYTLKIFMIDDKPK
jgi:hypothetical protein